MERRAGRRKGRRTLARTARQTFTAGHYAYGPAGLAHEGACKSAQPCTLFIAFDGPVDAEAVTGPIS